ncbi:hypothetical protein ACX27_03820 [Nostoc piscinale CENA21]|uniref:TOX high mobility group box family member 3 n=1 Tax=Nostoc piscinale CENA21 TaxID=224013 RepID=A0A0M4TU52_9NOSO|nr:hypothetical protein [Nostoc piscinale]ALF52176.1 hypothetical protein ACX27_03820 [Nostoc piscinale CENA21]
MNNLSKIKSGLLLAIVTTNLGMNAPVKANTHQTINQQSLEQKRKQVKRQSPSQELWERFRQRQDEFRLQQQHRIEQFRLENQFRSQKFEQLARDRLRLQQRQEIDTLRLQQKLRNPY